MRHFRVVFWFVDGWDASFDHMDEAQFHAVNEEDAVCQFREERGERHLVQFVEEVS